MKFPSFSYAKPASLAEVTQILAEDDSARVIAGGQSLLPLLAFRLAYPSRLIDLSGVSELEVIRKDVDSLVLGAMVTHVRNLTDPTVAECMPIIPKVVEHVAHEAVRSRGTVGGSVCHSDAAAEMPALMIALQARMHIAGQSGSRVLPAEEFLLGHYTTALEPGEILTHIQIPFTPYLWAFEEIVRRKGDFALAMAFAGLKMDQGRCTQARLVMAALCERPTVCSEAVQFLTGKAIDESVAEEAAGIALQGLSVRSDIHGSEDLRKHQARAAMKRAILRASKGE